MNSTCVCVVFFGKTFPLSELSIARAKCVILTPPVIRENKLHVVYETQLLARVHFSVFKEHRVLVISAGPLINTTKNVIFFHSDVTAKLQSLAVNQFFMSYYFGILDISEYINKRNNKIMKIINLRYVFILLQTGGFEIDADTCI